MPSDSDRIEVESILVNTLGQGTVHDLRYEPDIPGNDTVVFTATVGGPLSRIHELASYLKVRDVQKMGDVYEVRGSYRARPHGLW